jgi:hypothetical protein
MIKMVKKYLLEIQDELIWERFKEWNKKKGSNLQDAINALIKEYNRKNK